MTPENSTPSAPRSWIPTVEKLTRWAEGVKSGSVTLLAFGAASISGIGVMHAVTSDSVALDPIKVPAPFEERGFTSEIATTRLLDEIATYQRQSSSAKERVSIQGKGSGDDLEKLQAPVAGVDMKMIQGLLGVKRERITGEITFNKEGNEPVYNVRLRRVPGNYVLLDITASGKPEAVLKQTALAMIEVFDPHIAAAIHWRNGDNTNALRMIDVVLGNDNPADDKYSLNLRSWMHIIGKRFDAAQADIDQILKIDPKFAPAYSTSSWLKRVTGNIDGSLLDAEKVIEYAPLKPWGYFQKAITLHEIKRDDEAEAQFQKALSLKLDSAPQFIRVAKFMTDRGKLNEAGDIYRKGLFAYANHAGLHANYGEWSRKQGRTEVALIEFSRALELDPKHALALAGKAEIEKSKQPSAPQLETPLKRSP